MPPIRADGVSNWTAIKTAVRRESAEITAAIGALLSERFKPASSLPHQYSPVEADIGMLHHLGGSMFTEKRKKKSMYLTFGEAILHSHNRGPLMAPATVQ